MRWLSGIGTMLACAGLFFFGNLAGVAGIVIALLAWADGYLACKDDLNNGGVK
jgi:hypothetical protein